MPWTSKHLKWLIDTGKRLTTTDGKKIEIWEFRHNNDNAILSAWTRHFRNHYCFDTEIDYLRNENEYLSEKELYDKAFEEFSGKY